MKRFRLATKLALAIVPIALVALTAGAVVSWTFLEEAREEERVSSAARVAADAMDALVAVSEERSASLEVALGQSDSSLERVRSASDSALDRLRESVRDLVPRASGPASGIASGIFSDSSLSVARLEDAREGDPLAQEVDELFDEVASRLITIASQSTLYFGDEARAREGEGAVALARAAFASSRQERLLARFTADTTELAPEEFQQQFLSLEATVNDWLTSANNNSPTVTALGLAGTQLLDPGTVPEPEEFPQGRDELLADTGSEILDRVSGAADEAAEVVRTEALTVAAFVLGVLFVTVVMALVVGRSIVRRVRSVTTAARHVSDAELPKLLDALSNPKGELAGSLPVELEQGGPDEVGELARSFGSLHGTLVEVANRQMQILRRGVSEIFVTLARRNGSLVDRQLALIDELESRQEDPEILDGYYKLDHLATRMRRNAESLLVLAGSESPRMWSEPLDIGDVVRAAMGEVDEYQRVDVLALEPARLQGRVVTDLAHLMSELLDNATQFSPPSERVRVTGLFDDEGYVITIADSGLGISGDRMAEINRLISDPPVLGLALEPTLGMYVVARLAARHGIGVRLVPGVPGTTVRITLPRRLLEAADDRPDQPEPAPSAELPETTVESDAGPVSAPIPPYAFRSGSHTGSGSRTTGERDREGIPARQEPSAAPSPPDTGAPPGKEDQSRPEWRRPQGGEPAPSAPPARDSNIPGRPPAARTPEKPATGDSPPSDGDIRDKRRSVPGRPDTTAAPPKDRPLPQRRATHEAEPPAGAGTAEKRQDRRPPRPGEERQERRPPPSAPRPVDTDQAWGAASRLPVRRPGSSFRGDVEGEGSSAVSHRGAEGIRDALDGYRLGRDIASGPTRPREKGEEEGAGGRPGQEEGGER